MGRCAKCSLITVEALRDNEVRHHDSLMDLRNSARDGCDFCKLCWDCLKHECLRKALDVQLEGRVFRNEHLTDTSIMLTGEFLDICSNGKGIDSCSKIWVHSGKKQDYYDLNGRDSKDGTEVYAALNVYAESGTPAAKYLVGRSSIASQEMRNMLTQRWLRDCTKHHTHCGGPEPKKMPTRVIDVGAKGSSKPPSLLVTDGSEGHYLALSYSWGDGVRHQLKLSNETLISLQQGFDESAMTASHREAVYITRELGFRYLWIDALCIIQGNNEDWASEARKMTQVYSNADLTIVAGWSDNSQRGFLNIPYHPSAASCALKYSRPNQEGVDLGECYAALPRSHLTGAVEKRAWCFQESVLSRRMVVYGTEQLAFFCQERNKHEDGTSRVADWGRDARYVVNVSRPFAGALSESPLRKTVLLRRWYEIVQLYTARELFHSADIFAASTGIAQLFHGGLEWRYLAGLWEGDMPRALLWRSRRIVAGPFSRTDLRRPRTRLKNKELVPEYIRAPSWSWAAVEGPVWHGLMGPHKEFQYTNPGAVQVKPSDQLNERWTSVECRPQDLEVKFCPLHISGVLKLIRCSNTPTSLYPQKPKWAYSRAKINELTVPLEPDDGEAAESSDLHVVAFGLFDMASQRRSNLWCMRLITQEGLLLERDSQGCYQRLGVFGVEDEAWFESGGVIDIVII